MEKNVERKVFCVKLEDHEYIRELYKMITETYKTMAALAGVKPTIGKKREGPKIRHIISFLSEYAVYGDRELQNFATRFVK
jgi:hypothetical protein